MHRYFCFLMSLVVTASQKVVSRPLQLCRKDSMEGLFLGGGLKIGLLVEDVNLLL